MENNTIIDLFSGCGGFGLGAELAGFSSKIAIDCEPILQSSYQINFPATECIQADLTEINAAFWKKKLNGEKIAGVIGGPPCQGFSTMGWRQIDDPRNLLIGHYFRHIMLIKPKFFILENVVGILHEKYDTILKEAIDLLNGKYKIVGPIILNAADFGAATNRKRVFIFGYDSLEVDAFSLQDLKNIFQAKKKVSVEDAISDLPSPQTGWKDNQYGFSWRQLKKDNNLKENLSDYAKNAKRIPRKKIGWQYAIAQQKKDLLTGFLPTCHTSTVKDRFALLENGKADLISKFIKLKWEGLCPVLRAGTGRERGGYQSARPIHPKQARVITVREAARLQGFPDWFVFHPTMWHSFRMIGNSVSPLVSQKLHSFLRKRVDF